MSSRAPELSAVLTAPIMAAPLTAIRYTPIIVTSTSSVGSGHADAAASNSRLASPRIAQAHQVYLAVEAAMVVLLLRQRDWPWLSRPGRYRLRPAGWSRTTNTRLPSAWRRNP